MNKHFCMAVMHADGNDMLIFIWLYVFIPIYFAVEWVKGTWKGVTVFVYLNKNKFAIKIVMAYQCWRS